MPGWGISIQMKETFTRLCEIEASCNLYWWDVVKKRGIQLHHRYAKSNILSPKVKEIGANACSPYCRLLFWKLLFWKLKRSRYAWQIYLIIASSFPQLPCDDSSIACRKISAFCSLPNTQLLIITWSWHIFKFQRHYFESQNLIVKI